MNIDDLILISVDDHIVEPADLFEGRMPKKFAARTPRVVQRPDGENVWLVDDVEVAFKSGSTAGFRLEDKGAEIDDYDLMRRGCWDIHERVKDMNANGVLAAMGFPQFPRFCGQVFSAAKDKEFALAAIQAYNDWHIDEWCGAYPGRFMPLNLVPLWDADLAAKEVKRVAQKGSHAIAFSENPSKLGYPSFYTADWDPLWAVCEEEGVVPCVHLGSSSSLTITSEDAPLDASLSLLFCGPAQAATDLIWSHVFERFPGLTFALSEGGVGWIPYLVEKFDYVYRHHHAWTGQRFPEGKMPSEIFLEHVVTCFVIDDFGVANRNFLNMDMLTWETDYPHPDGTWPHSPEVAMTSLKTCSDADINRVTHENAMRIFQFDPFKHVTRDQCRVGALRSQVPDHDISIRSLADSGQSSRRTMSKVASGLATANV